MKLKKILIIIIIISCVTCFFTGAKHSKYYGTYVCTSDPSCTIELLDFSLPHRKGKAHFKNIKLPRYGIKSHSQFNVPVEVYRKDGKVLSFRSMLDSHVISGTLDLNTKTVNIGGCIYVKS
ncbi:MAG: hypothetical protein PHC84_00475 [Clostridia bacterium]|nr:hypothetical protein [Clostridia bacterium]